MVRDFGRDGGLYGVVEDSVLVYDGPLWACDESSMMDFFHFHLVCGSGLDVVVFSCSFADGRSFCWDLHHDFRCSELTVVPS